MAVAISHTASFEYTAVDTDHDEAGVAIGTAAADRLVFVLASGPATSTGSDINSMTVGGVAATRVRRDQVAYDGAFLGSFQSLEIWWAAVPTGATATISFTHDADLTNGKFSVYAVTGSSTTAPISDHDGATRSDALTNALSVSVDVPANGGAIGLAAGALFGTSVTAAWTYLTEDLDNDHDGGGFVIGFSSASATTAGAALGQAVTATLSGSGSEFNLARGLSVVTILEFVDPELGAASATGAGAATAAAASIAASAFSAFGAATATAVGESTGAGQASAESAGAAVATAVSAVIASVAGHAEGAAAAVAASPEAPVVTYPPVGGGGGIAPPYYSEQQRFRIRKEKSKPRVYVIKTGNWPTEEELARAEREEQREFSRFVNGIQPNRAAPVESDDEEELVAILSMLA